MNEFDRTLLDNALNYLYEDIRDKGAAISSMESALANTSATISARQKLKKIAREPQDFSPQELKVMYWAVYNLREMVRDFLENGPLTGDSHTTILETQRACNRQLRFLASSLSQLGIDIRQIFPRH